MASKAYEYALDLLSARPYTTRNLRRKLLEKAYEPDEITAAIERLETARLLDDGRFAEDYARQKLTVGGSAVRRVGQELAQRGIRKEVIASAVERVLEEENVDTGKSIDAAARKKVATMVDLDIHVKRRRLFAFLMRRGFEIADVQRATEAFLPLGER